MATLLSTKKLEENQRYLLLNAGLSFVEYDAIKISELPFDLPLQIENAIFTSQNAVNTVLEKHSSKVAIENCFCVGEKTKALLEEYGQKVMHVSEYAEDLAEYLTKYHNSKKFVFFCGNIRSEIIPSALRNNRIHFTEITVYKTTLTPKQFDRHFEGILFFSPSGVRSFMEANKAISDNTLVVCIGKTTASEAKNFSKNVIISNKTTVESVIAKAVKLLT